MSHLMTFAPAARHTARRIGRLAVNAVRSVVNPAALVKAGQTTAEPAAPVTVAEPTDLYTPDEMPELVDIERAALGYDLAADAARSADRNKRKHRKLLDKLPSGRFGAWIIERKPSTRMTPDLAEIERLFRKHNLGAVPMRPVAPSLVVKPAPAPAEAAPVADEDRELVTA